MCWTVGHWLLQKGHLASGLNLHHRKFRGVGSVSDPALSRNDSYPAGIPFWICFQTLFWDSSSVMSVNLLWTVNSLSLSFQCLTQVSRWTLVHLRDRVLVVIVDMEFFARAKTWFTSEGIHWLLVKPWSSSNSEISVIIGSFKVRIERGTLILLLYDTLRLLGCQ